jgi:hypothetical protein
MAEFGGWQGISLTATTRQGSNYDWQLAAMVGDGFEE